ncbi:efflux RND transporter periplasmic adaptor subunit [Pseudomonas sp. xss_2]|uniref:efflux RND transporter periplasmic adaptor subunit n=1 Tax=Pseudomonas sp. xss_2 TaxID=3367215 RepID=UPI00370B4AA6
MIDTHKSVVAGIATLAACLLMASCKESDAAVVAQAPVPEVIVLSVRSEPLRLTTILPGRTRANLVAEVRPQVGGILLKRAFQEGAEVKEGQLLYQIDTAPYRAALTRAEASLDSAQSLMRRYESLVKSHAISQQQYDDARSQYLQANAAVESARIDLGYTRITAPISGRIGRSKVTQGALVTANQAAELATVQQLDPIYVDIVQPSIALLQLKDDLANGQLKSDGKNQADIRVKLENGRDYAYTGKLQFSEVSVDESTGSVTLRAIFPNPQGDLLPGMFVRAELEEGVRQQALLVPQRAVSRDSQGKTSVFVVDANNAVKERELTIERAVDGQWLISDGLKVGTRVIVDGIQHVRPGMKVKPIELGAITSAASPTFSSK